jgi:hypothetical protein
VIVFSTERIIPNGMKSGYLSKRDTQLIIIKYDGIANPINSAVGYRQSKIVNRQSKIVNQK